MSEKHDSLRRALHDEAAAGGPAFSAELHERTMQAVRREQFAHRDARPAGLSRFFRGFYLLAEAAVLLLALTLYLTRDGVNPAAPGQVGSGQVGPNQLTQQPPLTPPTPALAIPIPNPSGTVLLDRTVTPIRHLVGEVAPQVELLHHDARALAQYLLNQLPTVPERM